MLSNEVCSNYFSPVNLYAIFCRAHLTFLSQNREKQVALSGHCDLLEPFSCFSSNGFGDSRCEGRFLQVEDPHFWTTLTPPRGVAPDVSSPANLATDEQPRSKNPRNINNFHNFESFLKCFFSICASQLSGCYLHSPDPRDIFLNEDLLCNGTCSVSRGSLKYWGGTNGKDPKLFVIFCVLSSQIFMVRSQFGAMFLVSPKHWLGVKFCHTKFEVEPETGVRTKACLGCGVLLTCGNLALVCSFMF